MHFGFDEDQLALRDAVAGLLEKKAGIDYLQQAWTAPDWSLWNDLAAMGVQGLMAPESVGGSGLDRVTTALVLAEAGRAALPLPLAETAAVAVPVIDDADLLSGLASGALVATASAGGTPVPSASRADLFILDDVLYRREEVRIEPVTSVDRTRDAAIVTPQGEGSPAPGAGEEGALATAALLVGLGRAMISMTVKYVKDRKQFGVPVGSFQAVKHHLADAAMHVEFAAPAVWAAAWEMDHPELVAQEQRQRSVSLAKALANDGAALAASMALQCHGAMGYTDEYQLHYWLKRVWCLVPSFGDSNWHRRRIGRLLRIEE